jgi:hypothetical protein
MQATAQGVYTQVVRNLLSRECLQLATLIPNELVRQQQPSIDQSDTWTEDGQKERRF